MLRRIHKEMAYHITEIISYDNKRNKVTLDDGEVAFLLYKGECRKLGIGKDKGELSDKEYEKIMEEILLPRAKKKVLYYLKNGDKTRFQIRQKLKEGLYPGQITDKVMQFLDRYKIADDARYAENYIEELKGSRSRREIRQKLQQKGLSGSAIDEQLEALGPEDEEAACRKAFQKKYPRGLGDPEDTETWQKEKRRAYAYLARKGFGYEVIRDAVEELADGED